MIKCEFHCHTKYSSCSNIKAKDIVEISKQKNIGVVAITDHNAIEGALELKRIAPLQVIVGEEIESSEGEIIGYFLKEKISPGLSLMRTIREIKNQQGLVCLPHPFDRLRKKRISEEKLKEILPYIDLIEVFNSRTVFEKDNILAKEFSLRHHLIPMVGSDAHFKFEIGRSLVEIENFNSPFEMIENLKKSYFVTKKSPIIVHLISKLLNTWKKVWR